MRARSRRFDQRPAELRRRCEEHVAAHAIREPRGDVVVAGLDAGDQRVAAKSLDDRLGVQRLHRERQVVDDLDPPPHRSRDLDAHRRRIRAEMRRDRDRMLFGIHVQCAIAALVALLDRGQDLCFARLAETLHAAQRTGATRGRDVFEIQRRDRVVDLARFDHADVRQLRELHDHDRPLRAQGFEHRGTPAAREIADRASDRGPDMRQLLESTLV